MLKDEKGVRDTHGTLEETSTGSYLCWWVFGDEAGEGCFELPARVCDRLSVPRTMVQTLVRMCKLLTSFRQRRIVLEIPRRHIVVSLRAACFRSSRILSGFPRTGSCCCNYDEMAKLSFSSLTSFERDKGSLVRLEMLDDLT